MAPVSESGSPAQALPVLNEVVPDLYDVADALDHAYTEGRPSAQPRPP